MKFAFFSSVSLACSLALYSHLPSTAASSRLRGNVDQPAASRDANRRVLRKEMIGTFLVADIDYEERGKGQRPVEAGDLRRPDRPSQTFNIEMADGSIYELRNYGEMSASGKGKVHTSGRDTIKIPRGAFVSGGTIDLGGADIEGVPKNLFHTAGRGLQGEEGAAAGTPAQERNLAALRRRQLQSGSKTVLVVRVAAADAAHAKTEAELGDDVLGTQDDPLNLASQYDACSYGALTFEGADDRARTGGASAGSTDIANGTVTVVIPNNVTGVADGDVRNAVTAQLATNFGTSASNLADHVMLCLPPGTSGSWIAYAYVNSWLSVYNNNWCSPLSAQMHEIGHNLGYAHSGEGDSTYGDRSGMMGYSYSSDDGPQMCFNAAKSWQTNWYAAKSTVVEPADVYGTPCFDGDLYGIADFGNPDADHVLVKINDVGATDHYVTFNSKRGINSGTVEAGDQVTVTTAGGEGAAYSESSLVAKLGAGGTYAQTIGGKNMVVTVVSTDPANGKARVRISEDGAPCGPVPPSLAPTPCPGAEVTVDVRTDNYPAETSWLLINTCEGDAIQESVAAGTKYTTPGTQYSDTYCVPLAEYRFEMLDTFGDGLCCAYGGGFYSVTYDGNEVALGEQFGSLDATTFGECGVSEPPPSPTHQPTNGPTNPEPTDAPTPLPTKAPTLPPTDAPTPLPTKAPTLPPTPPPTNPPTDQPTKSPTSAPTAAPTHAPTSPPTDPPTDQPTKSPTSAPTAVPTHAPTSLPTKRLTLSPTSTPTTAPTERPTKTPTTSPIPVPTDAPTPPLTKEPTLPPTLPPTSPPTKPPTDQPTKSPTSAPTAVPTPPPTNVVTSDRMLYCGIPNKCNGSGGNMVKVSMNDRAGVRCCTTNQSLGWPDKCATKSDPRIFGESNVPTCYLESTFQEAVDICGAYDGGRLCTGEELMNKCTRGTGCNLNNMLVWGCTPGGMDAGTCGNSAECCSGACNDGICA